MSEWKKLLSIVGITLAVYLLMKCLLPYVVPFLIAYIMVRMLNPVSEKICRRILWKKEVIVSVLLTILLAVCFFRNLSVLWAGDGAATARCAEF